MAARPYELLVRFKPDGTVSGASIRMIQTVDGKDYEGDPEPLTGTKDPAFDEFAALFNVAAVAERDSLQASLAVTADQITVLTSEKTALTDEKTDLTNRLDEAVAELEDLKKG